jgi:hypothetical protein
MAFREMAQNQSRHRLAKVEVEKKGPAASLRDKKLLVGVAGRMGKLHTLFAAQKATVAPEHETFSVVHGFGEDVEVDVYGTETRHPSKDALKLAERIYLASLSGDVDGLSAALSPIIAQAEAAEAAKVAADEAARAAEAAAAAAQAAAEAAAAKGKKGAPPPPPPAESVPPIAVEVPPMPDWRVVDVRGLEPLALACARGHAEAAKMLLKARASVDAAAHSCGRTALHRAVEGGHLATVMTLLDGKADPTLGARNGVCALQAAAARGHLEIVSLLLSLTVPVPPPTLEEIAAAEASAAAAAKGAKGAPPPEPPPPPPPPKKVCRVDQPDHSGLTPLMVAAKGGYSTVLKALLDGGADPSVTDINGWGAVHHACRSGHREVALSLARAGADVGPTKGGRKLASLDARIAADVEALLASSPPVAARTQRPMTAPP